MPPSLFAHVVLEVTLPGWEVGYVSLSKTGFCLLEKGVKFTVKFTSLLVTY